MDPDFSPTAPTPAPCRVVLLGGDGLLGSAFRRAWAGNEGFEIKEFPRAELNLTRPDQIHQTLDRTDFDLLINAAAYTQVDDAEVQPDLAMAVNARAAGTLAALCTERGARMVHFSTDYVFDGRKSTPYTETDPPHPLSTYGASKAEGEALVAAASPRHLIIRLAWLFGPGRDAFPEWVLHQALRHDEIRVVSDKTGTPTYSMDVPGWVQALLSVPVTDFTSAPVRPDSDFADFTQSAELASATTAESAGPASGIVHLVNGPPCSWLEYAQGVLHAAAARGWPLRTTQITPVPLSSLPGLTAARPVQSALDTSRFTGLTGITPRPWTEAMAQHLASKPLPG